MVEVCKQTVKLKDPEETEYLQRAKGNIKLSSMGGPAQILEADHALRARRLLTISGSACLAQWYWAVWQSHGGKAHHKAGMTSRFGLNPLMPFGLSLTEKVQVLADVKVSHRLEALALDRLAVIRLCSRRLLLEQPQVSAHSKELGSSVYDFYRIPSGQVPSSWRQHI